MLGLNGLDHIRDRQLITFEFFLRDPNAKIRLDVTAQKNVGYTGHRIEAILQNVAHVSHERGAIHLVRRNTEPQNGLILGVHLTHDRRVQVPRQNSLSLR